LASSVGERGGPRGRQTTAARLLKVVGGGRAMTLGPGPHRLARKRAAGLLFVECFRVSCFPALFERAEAGGCTRSGVVRGEDSGVAQSVDGGGLLGPIFQPRLCRLPCDCLAGACAAVGDPHRAGGRGTTRRQPPVARLPERREAPVWGWVWGSTCRRWVSGRGSWALSCPNFFVACRRLPYLCQVIVAAAAAESSMRAPP